MSVQNTSATGGFLQPQSGSPYPLEGQGLSRFLQTWVAGICGLDGSLVRPRWQPDQADLPTGPWAAVGVTARGKRGFPQVVHHSDDPLGHDRLTQWEWLRILCSFYDLGSVGMADYYATMLRDGLFIPQNSEVLQINGFGLEDVGDMTAMPELVKSRWYYRIDYEITLNRAIARDYPIFNLVGAEGTIQGKTYSVQFDTGEVE